MSKHTYEPRRALYVVLRATRKLGPGGCDEYNMDEGVISHAAAWGSITRCGVPYLTDGRRGWFEGDRRTDFVTCQRCLRSLATEG